MSALLVEDELEAPAQVNQRAIGRTELTLELEIDDSTLHDCLTVCAKCKVQHDVIFDGLEARSLTRTLVVLKTVEARSIVVHAANELLQVSQVINSLT
jgi:hypothetical protein